MKTILFMIPLISINSLRNNLNTILTWFKTYGNIGMDATWKMGSITKNGCDFFHFLVSLNKNALVSLKGW